MVAWVVGLGGLVGFGALGGQAAPSRDRARVAVTSPSPSAAPIQRQIALDQPARRGEVITTRELIVRGRVARSAGQVRIMLESSNGKPMAIAAVDPTGFGHGGWIPFESRFRISTPRPGGDMLVFVVALDADGIPIDAVRRRFTVGAIVEIPARIGQPDPRPEPRRARGEDGIMGGIPFGTNTRQLRAGQ